MARYDATQTNFTAGALSPRIRGRIDQSRYYNGVAILENFNILPLGGINKTSGTRFVIEVKDSDDDTRLIPFEFSTTQTYALEFGDQYIRFHTNEGTLLEGSTTITSTTGANPVVVTDTGHPYSNGDQVFITGTSVAALNNKYYLVNNVTVNTYELQDTDGNNIDGTGFGASTGGSAARVYEIASPYASSDVFEIQYTQSADVIYLVHPDYEPRKLERLGATNWTLSVVDFIEGPFQTENTTDTTLTPSGGSYAVGDSPTVTASSTDGINGGDGFQTTDVGRLLRIYDGTEYAWGEITARASTTEVTVLVKGTVDFPSSAQTKWALGEWSETTGWPSSTTFYEQRLFFANIRTKPQTLWGSVSADIENFTPSTEPDSAVTYTIASVEVNAIRWLLPARFLILGTAGAVFNAGGGISLEEAISVDNFAIKRQVGTGCADVLPVLAGDNPLFVRRTKRRVSEYIFSFDKDAFTSPDLTLLADHLTLNGVEELSWAESPDYTLWARTGDGDLLSCTYYPEQQIYGWARHTFSGDVKSICTILSPDEEYDQVHMIVEREIDGVTRKYIEFMEEKFEQGDDPADAFFVHSGLTYDGVATTTITGLDHLEGETVSVLADGAARTDKVVSGGSITLAREASKVQVGLPYTARVEMMPFDSNAEGGRTHGFKKLQYKLILQLDNTLGLKVRDAESDEYIVDFRKSSDLMDQAPPLRTGFITEQVPATYQDYEMIEVLSDQPLPCTILSAIYRTVVSKI